MRTVALIVSLSLVAACRDEPDFDARYDRTVKEIDARAKAMDADIAETDKTPQPDAGPAHSTP